MERPGYYVNTFVPYTDEEIIKICDSIEGHMNDLGDAWLPSDILPYDDPGNIRIRDRFKFLGRPYPVLLRGSRARMQANRMSCYNSAKYHLANDILKRYIKKYKLTRMPFAWDENIDDSIIIQKAAIKLNERYSCEIRNMSWFVGGNIVYTDGFTPQQHEMLRDMLVMNKKAKEIEKKIRDFNEEQRDMQEAL